MLRRPSKQIHIGTVTVGGGAPVSIQSMTNTDTRNADATLAQIRRLAEAGCQIIRCAVPDAAAAEAMADIVKGSPIPVIADIHFDWRLALASIKAGVHAVRINPGNIGSADRVRAVVEAAGNAGIPIRVGANAGSLPKGLLEEKLAKHHGDREAALAESLCDAVQGQIHILQACSFQDIKVSLKASSVPATVMAYRQFAKSSDLPLHVGVTEAGTTYRGIHKSAAGIGTLLLEGIGDTIRVSLTADPLEEVRSAIALLEAVGLRDASPELVSCPSCGRTAWDLFRMADQVEDFIARVKASGKKIRMKKIAVMGCVVNGPGEAKDADIGLAGGNDGRLIVFKFGQVIATLPEAEALEYLKKEVLRSADFQQEIAEN